MVLMNYLECLCKGLLVEMIENSLSYLEDHGSMICLQSPFSRPPQIPATPGFDFNEALENLFPLTDMICVHLEYQDLLSVSDISDTWKISAKKELSKRDKISWICLNGSQIEMSDNFKEMDRRNSLFFYAFPNLVLNKEVCMHKDEAESMPFYAFLDEHIMRQHKYSKNYACISVKDIPLCEIGKKKTKLSTYYCIGVMFPVIPNIRILKFYYKLNPATNIKDVLRNDEVVKALIVFGITNPKKELKKLNKDLRAWQGDTFALGGGLVWGINVISPHRQSFVMPSSLYCIAFVEENRFDHTFFSATAIIRESHSFEFRLNSFQQSVEHREQSVMFRFCCIEKIENLEDKLIRYYFPNIVLIPMRVNGEIGYDYNWRYSKTPKPVFNHRDGSGFCLEYTTVLVYLTWGDLVKPQKGPRPKELDEMF